jgi:hypothetical protein
MEFSRFIREIREKNYKSVRSFYEKKKLSCSYFYYTKIESGTVPDIALAIEVLNALGADHREGLHAWVRDQMPTVETKAMFRPLSGGVSLSAKQTLASESVIINRGHKALLESDPVYWELLAYLTLYYGYREPTDAEVAKKFSMPIAKVRKFLSELYDLGLIDKGKKGGYKTKRWVYIPFEPEFDKLRDQNFNHALKKFQASQDPKRYRTTITRLVTPNERDVFESLLTSFLNSIVDHHEDQEGEGEPCTVGVFLSERTFG